MKEQTTNTLKGKFWLQQISRTPLASFLIALYYFCSMSSRNKGIRFLRGLTIHRLLFIVAITLSLPVFLAAQGAKPSTPQLVVNQNSYNFGEVFTGEEPAHTFQIRNAGNAPLNLSETPISGALEGVPNRRILFTGGNLQ